MFRYALLLASFVIYSVSLASSQTSNTNGTVNGTATDTTVMPSSSTVSSTTSYFSSSPATSSSSPPPSSSSSPVPPTTDSSPTSMTSTPSPSSSSSTRMFSTTTTASDTLTTALPYAKRMKFTDPSYIAVVTAIVAGFGLLLLLLLLFVVMTVLIRHVGRRELMRGAQTKKPKKGDAPFYFGKEPQSSQYLVSSMSNQSFGSSPSDPHLEINANPGVNLVQYNRAFDRDGDPRATPYAADQDGFKPIHIVAAEVTDRSKVSKV